LVAGCTMNQRSAKPPGWSFERSMSDSSQAMERERAKGRIPPAKRYSVPEAPSS
jgi:hypothetical protein